MGRNIVLCCDGTSNQFARDRTNVAKLFHALDKDPARQAVYYHPGIGTRAPTGIGTKAGTFFGRLAGLAVGYGLQDDIVDGYRFLVDTYQPGDQVYLFGFSRGAYTARALAAMLTLYGLIPKGNDALVPYITEMMWKISGTTGDDFTANMALAADFKRSIAVTDCPVHFLGVWDTVNSVGWVASPLALPYTRSNPAVAIVRHAKALDERRGFFRVNWFTADKTRDILELWFPGNHGDVGGGWPEAESGLSKHPLCWMIEEARKAGLVVDQGRFDEVMGLGKTTYALAANGPLHQANWLAWGLLEFAPKKRWNFETQRWEWRCNLFRRRTVGKEPLVHKVAWTIPGYALPEGAVPYEP